MLEDVVLAEDKDQVGLDSNTDKFFAQKEWLVLCGGLAQHASCDCQHVACLKSIFDFCFLQGQYKVLW